MRFQLRFISKLVLLTMALGLAQCSKKTKSQDVLITVTPTSPIVFTSDFSTTKGGNVVVIKGPWFSFTVQIDNQSDTPITLIGLHIDVTGFDASNNPVTVGQDFVPTADNYSTLTQSCTYSDFGEFEAKGQTSGTPPNQLTSSGTMFETPSGSTGCTSGPVLFFAQGNPKPASTALIRYTVKVSPIGYFGKRNAPTDRFDGSTTIYTQ
jgi:hypothetical protein